ncbi:MAG: hypothetical protein IJ574_04480 [Bacilli bacterium]|nr:hypothetical protein [Bacilli bacterium]
MGKILICSDASIDSNRNDIYEINNSYAILIDKLKDLNITIITDIEVLQKNYNEDYIVKIAEIIKMVDLVIFDTSINNGVLDDKISIAKKYKKKIIINHDNIKNDLLKMGYKEISSNTYNTNSLSELVALFFRYCEKYNIDNESLKQNFYYTIYGNNIMISIINKGILLDRIIIPFDYYETSSNLGKRYFCDHFLNDNYNTLYDSNLITEKVRSLKKASPFVAIS